MEQNWKVKDQHTRNDIQRRMETKTKFIILELQRERERELKCQITKSVPSNKLHESIRVHAHARAHTTGS